MRMIYAIVTDITSLPATVGGFLKGEQVSKHRVTVTEVRFGGGYKFLSIDDMDEDGSVVVQGLRVEVGDSFRLMLLPCGQVVSIHPERIAHLPARDLVRQMGLN